LAFSTPSRPLQNVKRISGAIAAELMANAADLLSESPDLKMIDILAAKVP
jgi:hypothetical protein